MRKLPFLLIVLLSCKSDSQMTNRLANSTSPYLLQHAENPVDWYPWGDEALNKALTEDKPILISIGYSSCHWCHVMAHESFEDSATAALMNKHFINIKVDREERPDVDQIYMDAVQKMGLNGGWPLNVFLTPDQKPFYGGTYFPNEGWKKLLVSINDAFTDNRDKINESAENFAKALSQSEIAQYSLTGTSVEMGPQQMDSLFNKLSLRFDSKYGGINKSPKFPMPSLWEMLLNYSHFTGNQDAAAHTAFTLEEIEKGGIYDQVGGGFSRYSVDGEWHVPHFEKMLYDNGQLLSLYANAYKLTGNNEFKTILNETAEWLEREMLDESGGFYSALDADSEGVEGKFYVWSSEEIKALSGEHYKLISDYYDVTNFGNWEETNVLRRLKSDSEILTKHDISQEELNSILSSFKKDALKEREKRIRPGLDSKIIAGWNGLTLAGLCESYQATGEGEFLQLAKTNATYLSTLISDGKLRRFPSSNLEGFLEDYAAVIQGFITYYETTFDPKYLDLADAMTKRVLDGFLDETEGFFFFTGESSERLIARKKEVFDNVIPASNSIMARNLYYLGTHLYNDDYTSLAREMTAKMVKLIGQEPEYLSNWATLAFQMNNSFAEIVIIGPEYQEFANELNGKFLPGKIITASEGENDRPMFEMKGLRGGKTTIYVCYNRSCKLPVNSVEEALEQLNK